MNYIKTGKEEGADILTGGKRYGDKGFYIEPTVFINAGNKMKISQEEIFGPVLPVRGYRSLEEVIGYVNARPRPLALYPFSNDTARVQLLLERVMSGGVSVNDALFHVAQHDLPFGGVGASGMGHYHGYEGFITFSKLRPVFYQARFSFMKFLAPPYGRFASAVLGFLTR